MSRDPWNTVEKRFFSKVEKTDSCWLWKGHKTLGYGKISMGRGNLQWAHRISYIIHKGEIPEKMLIMHTCDNPPCVNPEHLEIGTYSINLKDAYKRGLHKPRRPSNECGNY
jgi:hypothetical protein